MMDRTPRQAPLAMDADTFRALGHQLVDQLASALDGLPEGPLTRDQSPSAVRQAFDLSSPLPESGTAPAPSPLCPRSSISPLAR